VSEPVWYEVDNGLVDLRKLVAIVRYTPAYWGGNEPNDKGEHAFVVGTLPAPDRYGKSEVYLFAGTWPEADAELERIKALLL
jgi:hypothetical protein